VDFQKKRSEKEGVKKKEDPFKKGGLVTLSVLLCKPVSVSEKRAQKALACANMALIIDAQLKYSTNFPNSLISVPNFCTCATLSIPVPLPNLKCTVPVMYLHFKNWYTTGSVPRYW